MYMLAKLVTEATGQPYEVDHIIPLRGKTVSGPHVENNLQVIHMHDNRVKYNSSITGADPSDLT
jgi:5-methylcytosine-specific restriction endonuclease McrA